MSYFFAYVGISLICLAILINMARRDLKRRRRSAAGGTRRRYWRDAPLPQTSQPKETSRELVSHQVDRLSSTLDHGPE